MFDHGALQCHTLIMKFRKEAKWLDMLLVLFTVKHALSLKISAVVLCGYVRCADLLGVCIYQECIQAWNKCWKNDRPPAIHQMHKKQCRSTIIMQ